jgi:HK97 family phage major capsid protein
VAENETLEQRRDRLVAALADPNITGDEARAIEAEAIELRDQIAERNRLAETRASLLAAVPAQPARPTFTEVRERPTEPETEHRSGLWTPGQEFTESRAWSEFRATGGTRMNTGVEVRALIDNAGTSGGAFQNPPRVAGVPQTNADRALRLADLIDRGTTDNNSVEYVRETAGGLGTAAEVAEGAVKPEATFTFEVVNEPVRTIASWVPITRQALDDNAQMRTYIDGRLRYSLEHRLDSQILNGTGTAPNLRGILNTTGINTYAPGTAEAAVLSIRRAMTLVQNSEYAPDTVVMHPTDFERVELSTDTAGAFRVTPNVANALAPRIWGLNVVTTTAISAGTAVVGAFRMGATLFDRQQTQVLVTDSHADYFIFNKLVILAEMRAALAVWRPKAFTRITFNGTA